MVDPATANSQLRRALEVFLIAILVAAFAATPALARGRITVSVAHRTPGVGQPFAVDVRTGFVVPANDWLRLVAVAPGKDWYHRHRRALVTLPPPGRWRLVLPNGTDTAFAVPPPESWMPWVDVHS